jgi:NADPH2:quinone reductase
LVYDPVGGDFAEAGLRSLAPGGRFLVVGFATGTIPKLPANLTLLKQVSIIGVNWGGHIAIHPDHSSPVVEALVKRIAAGKISPLTGQHFRLEDTGVAMTAMLERQAIGKTIISQE